MSADEAKRLARRARKMAPATMYDFARNFEKAIDELVTEVEALKKATTRPGDNANSPREVVGRTRSWT